MWNLVKSVALYIKVIVSRFSKAIYYSAIPVIAFFSFTNSAVAADTATMAAADTWNDNDSGSVDGDVVAAGDHVSGLQHLLTINTLSDNVSIGDIVMTTGHVKIINTDGGGAMTMTINSITSTTGNLDIDMIDEEDDMTVTIAGAIDIGGTLNFTNADAADNKTGILDINGTVVVDGATTLVASNSGSSTLRIAGATATFTGVTTLTDDTGLALLHFDGTSAQTVTFTGAMGGNAAGKGTLDVVNTGGIVTFASAIGSGSNLLELEVSADAEAIFQSTVDTILFDIDNDVTLFENGNTIGTDGTNAGSLNFAADAVLTINDTIVAGETIFTGTTAATQGLVIADSLTVNLPSNFTSGTITFWNGDTGDTTTDVANTTMNDTALTDYTANVADSDQDMTFTVSKKSDATCASELSVNTDVCNAFEQARDSAISNTNADASAEDAFTTVLNTATAATTTQMAKQVSPQTDGFMGVAQSVFAVNSSIMGIASTRLASLRQGDGFATGFAAGSSSLSNSIFIKPFGHLSEGSAHGGVAGFETQTRGISFGFDHVTRGGAVIGLSYSTSETEVDGDGAGNVEHDFDTQQLTFYGDYSTDKVYIEAMVGLARNDNDTSRTIAEGGIDRTAKGSYDSYQASFNVSGGVPLRTNKNGYITPILSLSTSLLNSDVYTETGATNLNLKIDPEEYFRAITSLGFRWHGVIDHEKGGTSVPEFRIGAGYDVGGDTVSTKANFTGGGSSFTVEGVNDRASATVGLGYTLTYGGVSFGISADAIAKEHGAGGSASAELKVKF